MRHHESFLAPVALCLFLSSSFADERSKAPESGKLALPPGVRFDEAVSYRELGDGKSLKLDVARPQGKGPFPTVILIPGGGWLSSAEDMARFEVAILNDKLLRRATRDLMWTPLKPSDGAKDNYALGWGVVDEDGVAAVGHTGGQQGTSTAFLLAPSSGAGVVVLTNMEGVAANDLGKEILKILLGVPAKKQAP